MPNALLVYPRHPPTFWGHNYALDILGIRAIQPPLGLLTVAALFPTRYDLRVVDLNVTSLEDADLEWADLVFTSTMIPQRPSLEQVIERCNRARLPVIAGGPHPTTFHEEIEGVDHFVLDEVEETFPTFLRDLENGDARAIYRAPRKPDVTTTPLPRFDLIDMSDYLMMPLQFSRGCPFDCEFCDITKSVRCEASRSCLHDLIAPRFGLTSRWKPYSRSGSLPVGQDLLLRETGPTPYGVDASNGSDFPTHSEEMEQMSEPRPAPTMRNAVDLGIVGDNILDIADFAIEKYEFTNGTTLSDEARTAAVEKVRDALWEMVNAFRARRKEWRARLFAAADDAVRDCVEGS